MEIEDLKKKHQWLNWRYDEKGSKIPYNSCTGYQTGPTENYCNEWVDYETANNAINKFNFSGNGIVLRKGLCGIDIDHRNINDPIVQDIINLMDTYTEYSPSGNGVHLLFTVDVDKLPTYFDIDGRKKLDKKYYTKNSKLNIECYLSDLTIRYFTFTGKAINNKAINERTNELLLFLNRYMLINNFQKENLQINNDIQKIINQIITSKNAEKFKKLFYMGDISDYDNDDSRADCALCSILSFYTKDFNTIDTIFIQSKLYRDKWDRPDYKRRTIEKALEGKNNIYTDSQSNKSVTELDYITARDLQKKELPPITYFVDKVLPQGLTIICSSPKMGKSWLALDLCLSICNGYQFLGYSTQKNGCLYLALEDSKNRLKERMNKLLEDREAPSNLFYSTNCNELKNGLIEQLERMIQENPSIKLIVIDTLQKVRSIFNNSSMYAQDYKELSKIKSFADKHNLAVVVIHHTRKGNDNTDIFENVSGTNGITGTADTTWIIHKKDRFKDETILSIIGRDVEANEYIMKFNKELCKWQMISTVEESEEREQRETYYNDTLVETIKTLIIENNGTWSGTINSLNDKHKELFGYEYAKNSQKIRNKINSLKNMLFSIDNIEYIPSPYPVNGKRLQTFRKNIIIE